MRGAVVIEIILDTMLVDLFSVRVINKAHCLADEMSL